MSPQALRFLAFSNIPTGSTGTAKDPVRAENVIRSRDLDERIEAGGT
jgi:hypothetical protein